MRTPNEPLHVVTADNLPPLPEGSAPGAPRPVTSGGAGIDLRAAVDLLERVASHMAIGHRHAGYAHDHLGENLTCAGCKLLSRVEALLKDAGRD